MKNPIFKKRSALLCLCGMVMLLFSCQKVETNIDNQAQFLGSQISAKGKKQKVNVCHNNHLINISPNAVPAHQGHGDAVDLDGDGYFDMDNVCSETDCNDNDPTINPGIAESCDPGNPTTVELLIGTWTTVAVSIETSVGGMSVTDYLIDVVGLSPADATAQYAILEAALASEVTGELTINPDNTYGSIFAGGSIIDSGTWSLSADEMTLTLFEGPVDTIVITIISISETMWNASTGDVIPLDVDGDPGTPDVAVAAMATVIFTK